MARRDGLRDTARRRAVSRDIAPAQQQA